MDKSTIMNGVIILLLVGILAYLLFNCPTKQNITNLQGSLTEMRTEINDSIVAVYSKIAELERTIS
jgi:type II secretory pathway component PulM